MYWIQTTNSVPVIKEGYFGFRSMMTNPTLARQFRKLAEQTADIARRKGLIQIKLFEFE